MRRITNDDIKAIIAKAKDDKKDVVVRDIAYVVLSEIFTDKETAYKAIFGASPTLSIEEYYKLPKMSYLLHNMPKKEDADDAKDSLTYDEIKAGLEDDLKRLEALRDSGSQDLDAKDMVTIVKQISDIRVKLKEKFGTTQVTEDRRIVVDSKFTKICPYCHREV